MKNYIILCALFSITSTFAETQNNNDSYLGVWQVKSGSNAIRYISFSKSVMLLNFGSIECNGIFPGTKGTILNCERITEANDEALPVLKCVDPISYTTGVSRSYTKVSFSKVQNKDEDLLLMEAKIYDQYDELVSETTKLLIKD